MLSLRKKAAQLLFPRIGSNMPPPVAVEADMERAAALLERCPVGGLVLFNGRLPALPEHLARLQALSPHPLLIASDIERGAGQQVQGTTVFPHAMAYAAAGDEGDRLLESSARATAREALACGLHIAFAPVADVNRDPRNPIIATRAFGTDPETAARLVRAYIRGCRAEGLLTTAKHFPGHGNTSDDSHATLPVVRSDRAEWERTDRLPFQAAIEEGVDLVMTAHVAYPALDGSGVPATRSRPILHDLLRGEMGFQGAVVTDSLLMGAIRTGPAQAGKEAAALLRAGVDLLLDVSDPEAVLEGLVQGAERDEQAALDIERAYGRVCVLRQGMLDRFGPDFFRDPGGGIVSGTQARALSLQIARRAVRVMEAQDGMLPLDPEVAAQGGMLAVLLSPHPPLPAAPPEAPLGKALRDRLPGIRFVEVGPDTNAAALERLEREAAQAECVVIAMVVKPAAWRKFGLLPVQAQFVERMTARRPVVLVSLGSPYILDDYPQAAARLCAYSDVPASQEALAEVLAGA